LSLSAQSNHAFHLLLSYQSVHVSNLFFCLFFFLFFFCHCVHFYKSIQDIMHNKGAVMYDNRPNNDHFQVIITCIIRHSFKRKVIVIKQYILNKR
jgi:hypothetical protein